LWLEEQDLEGFPEALLKAWTEGWQSLTSGPETACYRATTTESARGLLSDWLGYSNAGFRQHLPVFPLGVPDKLLRAAECVWMPRIVATRGACFSELSGLPIPTAAKEKAADLACQYYQQHPEHLTEDAIRNLGEYLPQSQMQSLRAVLPPAVPAFPPETPDDVFRWFTEQYLPFRQWASAASDVQGSDTLDSLCMRFATWYLDYYPRAIASGDLNVAFRRAAAMQTVPPDEVLLMVVLDGLHAADATVLVKTIARHETRMTVSRNALAFAPLPTITETCKPALIYGCAPRDVARNAEKPSARVLSEGHSPELRAAVPGQLFVWTLADPDRTYHARGAAPLIRARVDAALDACAKAIAEACTSVPSHLRLKVVITTDHGRLIGTSPRSQQAPDGMAVHQRAACGPYDKVFPASGVIMDEHSPIAVLHGPRFGISDQEHAAVLLSAASFYMNDGRGGEEFCPHGGLFPEEVIIPWVELRRDAEPPLVTCEATGTAKEATTGTLHLKFVNGSQIEVQIVSIECMFGRSKHTYAVSGSIPPLSQEQLDVAIPSWPGKREAMAAKIMVSIRLPSGDTLTVAAEAALDSEGFYVQDDDVLGGLT
jgi:hypothetical protein